MCNCVAAVMHILSTIAGIFQQFPLQYTKLCCAYLLYMNYISNSSLLFNRLVGGLGELSNFDSMLAKACKFLKKQTAFKFLNKPFLRFKKNSKHQNSWDNALNRVRYDRNTLTTIKVQYK